MWKLEKLVNRHSDMLSPFFSTLNELSLYSWPYSTDYYGRCRWSTNSDEPLLFVKYDFKKLNILDSEKKIMTLKEPMQLDPSNFREALF